MSNKENISCNRGDCKETQQTKTKLNKETGVNAHYKDTVFRMLFKDKKRLLGLYNAVSEKNYTNPDALEIITLESAVYMGMKNDLVEECIEQDILREFLLKEKAEVKRMSLLECSEELALEIAKESGEEEGMAKGMAKGMAQMLIDNIDTAMQNFRMDLPEACRGLGHTLEEYEKAKELLNSRNK